MEFKQIIGYLAIFSIIQSVVAYSDISQEGSLLEENSSFKAEILTSHNASSNLSVLIGNNKFTFVMGNQYGRELMWKQFMEEEGVDLVGNALGLYASYEGSLHDINYTSVSLQEVSSNKLDISFNAYEGEHHMVLFDGLDGIYSYFVNKNLPVLGEFRTLFRLNPEVYTNAHTSIKDQALPLWPEDYQGKEVFDETWLDTNNTGYITKYDWSSRLHEEEVCGVYGQHRNRSYGFWLISPGRDYYCGDNIKQELLVHRESSTGDVVLLNMLHGTHFQVENEEEFPEDKIWGPYLWYFNDGSISDANRRLKKEQHNWPYKWFNNKKFSSRGSLKGRLVLSNGAPASNVNLFLGNSDYTMVQGASYQYTGYTDEEGYFQLNNIRTENKYYLQAYTSEWSSKYTNIGGIIGNFTYNEEIEVKKDSSLDLGKIEWKIKDYELIWQIGTYDRTSKGFKNGGVSYRDFQTEEAPAEFEFTIGDDSDAEWYYAKGKPGTWTINFTLDEVKNKDAELYISLAGYTGNNSYVGGNSTVLRCLANGFQLDRDEFDTLLTNDKSTYRSSSFAGNWFYSKLTIPKQYIAQGNNKIQLINSEYSENKGIIWDSLKLVWKP